MLSFKINKLNIIYAHFFFNFQYFYKNMFF